jgi:hypothetical protein
VIVVPQRHTRVRPRPSVCSALRTSVGLGTLGDSGVVVVFSDDTAERPAERRVGGGRAYAQVRHASAMWSTTAEVPPRPDGSRTVTTSKR